MNEKEGVYCGVADGNYVKHMITDLLRHTDYTDRALSLRPLKCLIMLKIIKLTIIQKIKSTNDLVGGSKKVKLYGQPKLLQFPAIKLKKLSLHGTVFVNKNEEYKNNIILKITLHPTKCFFVSKLNIFILKFVI